MKKIDKDPFSNGTEFMLFETYNCDKCVKASKPMKDGFSYSNADENNSPNRCSIQRDIVLRMASNQPINQRTIYVCDDFTLRDILCPYLKTERKKYAKKQPKNQQKLEL